MNKSYKDNTQKKHIFLLFFHLGLGGIQRKIVDLVNHVDGNAKYKDVVIHIVVRRREEGFNFESQLPKNFKLLHIESVLPTRKRRIVYVIYLIYLIFTYNPVILVPFLHHTTAYATLMKYIFFWKRIKVVVGQDNILSFENELPHTIKIHSNRLLKFCYKRADKVITQTIVEKDDLVENYSVSNEKVFVIKNWLKNTKLLTNEKKYDIIYCGRFSAQKKLIRILKITLLLKKKLPKIQVCLIGDGPEKAKIKSFIKKNNLSKNIILKQPTMSIIEEISKSKIFILTSDFEGHPMVLLEAMSQKVVPVILKYPGVHEYLDHEKNGFIENSYQAMSQRIINLLKNDKYRKKIGKNARDSVINSFDDKLIDETLKSILT